MPSPSDFACAGRAGGRGTSGGNEGERGVQSEWCGLVGNIRRGFGVVVGAVADPVLLFVLVVVLLNVLHNVAYQRALATSSCRTT